MITISSIVNADSNGSSKNPQKPHNEKQIIKSIKWLSFTAFVLLTALITFVCSLSSSQCSYSLIMRILPANSTKPSLESNLFLTTPIQTYTSFAFNTKYFHSSKCFNKETVLISCAYPAKDPNLELCQGSGIYNFKTQRALQTINCYGDWRKVIEYQPCKPDYEFY